MPLLDFKADYTSNSVAVNSKVALVALNLTLVANIISITAIVR